MNPLKHGALFLTLGSMALFAAAPAFAQQQTGAGAPDDDSLTWKGITLYGVIDAGIQYDTHSAPFTPYLTEASGNIIRSNGYESVTGVTPSNMQQSRIGLRGTEHLISDFSAVFQIETFFNPQSGELVNAMKSVTRNNGKTATQQTVGVDGSSAGQAFQTAFAGIHSDRFGTLTIGRQSTLLLDGMLKYDPNSLATAFGLLGSSSTYNGGGSNEDNRLDDVIKYQYSYGTLAHAALMYKFNQSSGASNTAWQANAGGSYGNASVDAYYSKVKDAISATWLTAEQVTALPGLGYTQSDSVSATISDNTAYSLMASYQWTPVKIFAGYEHIKLTNPDTPLQAGFEDIGGYVLAFVNNTAYTNPKQIQLYWTGVRYTLLPGLELTAAYYHAHQDAYGTGAAAGCSTTEHSTCSGSIEAFSFNADYRFNTHFDVYAGVMYSGVDGGMASGYLYSTNINPTMGFRFKF